MEDKKEKTKKQIPFAVMIIILIILSVLFSILFRKSSTISGILDAIAEIIKPFLYGLVFAFLLAPVYDRLKKHMPGFAATTICLLIICAAIFLFGWMLIPQLIASIKQVINTLPMQGEKLIDYMGDKNIINDAIEQSIRAYTTDFGETASTWVSDELIPNIGKYALTFSSGLVSVLMVLKNVFIGIIIMVYYLNMKVQFKAQLKKLCYSVLTVDNANAVVTESRYVKEVFSKFIIGKIIDSVIIGILTFIVISIFRIPYAVLIAVTVGVTNIIPYFGPFIGAIPCAFLLLLVSPIKCLEFCIIILIIQQLDGNVIGPKILGEATGVSSFWVLASILIFGGLFGVFGMIIAVPAFAVIMRLVKKKVDKRLQKKELPTNIEKYVDLKCVDAETHEFTKNDGAPIVFERNLQEKEEPEPDKEPENKEKGDN